MKATLLMPGGMALVVVALTAALSACSGPAGQGGATPGAAAATGPASPAATAPVLACEPQHLLVVMDPNSVRPAGGSVYLPIDFVNESVPCSLSGYAQVYALTARGRPIFEAAQRPAFPASAPAATVPKAGNTPTPAASASAPGGGLVLRRHYAAHAWVLVANVTGPRPAGCKEHTASALRLYLPGAAVKQHSYVEYPFTSCVRGKRPALSVFPFLQGLANPAIFP